MSSAAVAALLACRLAPTDRPGVPETAPPPARAELPPEPLCTAATADCDGDPANGCEVDTSTSSASCGACGRACDRGEVCRASSCALAPIVEVATNSRLCVRREGGTVQCVPELTAVQNIDDARGISVGDSFACAIRTGSISCWDFDEVNHPGAITYGDEWLDGPFTGTEGALEVWVGGEHACVLDENARVMCFGAGGFGTLGHGVDAWSPQPVTVRGLESMREHGGVVGLGGGYSHSCARFESGALACWGRNQRGQLGDGTRKDRWTAVRVRGIDDAVGISGGLWHGCALRREGTVACWGGNELGELGDGTTRGRTRPRPVPGIADAVQIGSSQHHTCVRTRAGEVSCWGAGVGDDHRAHLVAGITGATDLDVDQTTCALLADGSVTCWGTNPRFTPGRRSERWTSPQVVLTR